MQNWIFSIFPNDNFVDLGLFQFGWEKCAPAHSFGPAARNHYLFIGEHSGRYEEFAEYMAKKEIEVYAIDFIGHGKSISETKAPMYFGGEGSFKYLVKDLIMLNEIVRQENKNIPCFMLGFSMGR